MKYLTLLNRLIAFTFLWIPLYGESKESFFPLGVYWPGECSFQELPAEERWKKIEVILTSLEKHQVNTIWITHMNGVDMAELARRAQKYQIQLVAKPNELIPNESIKESEYPNILEKLLKDWGNAPKPFVWSFGDEPEAKLMLAVNRFAALMKQKGEQSTVITTTVDVRYAGKILKNIDALAIDFYPFYSENNSNGVAGGEAGQIQYYIHNMRVFAEEGARLGKNYWMMAQGSTEAWGPSKINERGDVVYLPGGGPHFIVPSKAQVEWQAWVALAQGSKGIFYYSLFLPNYTKAVPPVKADGTTYAYKVETDSGNPPGFMYPNGDPTVPMTAMGQLLKILKDSLRSF